MSNNTSTIKSSNQMECHLSTPCMLCDEPVLIHSPIQAPRICSKCKSLWKEFIAIRNNMFEEQTLRNDRSSNFIYLNSQGKLEVNGNEQ